MSKPNILYITLDQFRGDALSIAGHPCVKTPHLDALAEDGIRFSKHYCQAAPCSPARASLHTGLYQMNHRVARNGSPLDARHATVATEARKAGYDPLLFGYADQSIDPREVEADDPRLLTYEGYLPGMSVHTPLAEDGLAWRNWLVEQGVDIGEKFKHIWRPRGKGKPKGPHREEPAFDADQTETAFLTNRMIEHLAELKGSDEAWFLHVSHLRPHPPFVVPAPYNAMYSDSELPSPIRPRSLEDEKALHPYVAYELERTDIKDYIYEVKGPIAEIADADWQTMAAVYFGMISEVDAQVGRKIAYLKENGLYDDTMIIVTSDHGEQLGDHYMAGKRGFFDSSFHIPLLIKPAGTSHKSGHVVEHFTESVDVMPTILEAIGVPVPSAVDGRALTPFFHGEAPADWRREARWEFDFRNTRSGKAQQALDLPIDACQLAVIRDEAFKYVHFTGLPPLLFDLKNDPDELKNLANDPSYAVTRAEYAGRMLSWRMAHADRTLVGWDLSSEKGPAYKDTDRGPY